MKMRSLLFACAGLLLFSCKKNDRGNSIHSYLQGSWRLVQVGADNNNNNIIEPEELISLPDTGIVTTMFNADGTGYGSFNAMKMFSMNANFRWAVNERDRVLTIHTEEGALSSDFKADDINSFHLLQHEMKIMGGKVWMVYERRK